MNLHERKPPKMARTRGLPPMGNHSFEDQQDLMMANSPQPSNHSELTTTSSNSDSGIGFHNDCTNISDRILVVDFPGLGRLRPPIPIQVRLVCLLIYKIYTLWNTI